MADPNQKKVLLPDPIHFSDRVFGTPMYFSSEKYNLFSNANPMPFNPQMLLHPPPPRSYNHLFGESLSGKSSEATTNVLFGQSKIGNRNFTRDSTHHTDPSPQLNMADKVSQKTCEIFDKVLGKKDSLDKNRHDRDSLPHTCNDGVSGKSKSYPEHSHDRHASERRDRYAEDASKEHSSRASEKAGRKERRTQKINSYRNFRNKNKKSNVKNRDDHHADAVTQNTISNENKNNDNKDNLNLEEISKSTPKNSTHIVFDKDGNYCDPGDKNDVPDDKGKVLNNAKPQSVGNSLTSPSSLAKKEKGAVLLKKNEIKVSKSQSSLKKPPLKKKKIAQVAKISDSSSSITSSSSDDEPLNKSFPATPSTNPPAPSTHPATQLSDPRSDKSAKAPKSARPSVNCERTLNTDIRGMSVAELRRLVTAPCSKSTQAKINQVMEHNIAKKRKVTHLDSQATPLPDFPASLDFSHIELRPVEISLPDVNEAIELALETSKTKLDVKSNKTPKKCGDGSAKQGKAKVKKSSKKSQDKASTAANAKVATKSQKKNRNNEGENKKRRSRKVPKDHDKPGLDNGANNSKSSSNREPANNLNLNDALNNNVNNNINNDHNSNNALASTSSAPSHTIPSPPLLSDTNLNVLLQMSLREEEISQQIDHMDADVSHLQKALNELTHKINMQQFYKQILASEAERLKTYRLQTLKDLVGLYNSPSMAGTPNTMSHAEAAMPGGCGMEEQTSESVLVIQPTNKALSSSESDSDACHHTDLSQKRKRRAFKAASQSTSKSSVDSANQHKTPSHNTSGTHDSSSTSSSSGGDIAKGGGGDRNSSTHQFGSALRHDNHDIRYLGSVNSSNALIARNSIIHSFLNPNNNNNNNNRTDHSVNGRNNNMNRSDNIT